MARENVIIEELQFRNHKRHVISEKPFSQNTSRRIPVVPGWFQRCSRGPKVFSGVSETRKGPKGSWGVSRVRLILEGSKAPRVLGRSEGLKDSGTVSHFSTMPFNCWLATLCVKAFIESFCFQFHREANCRNVIHFDKVIFLPWIFFFFCKYFLTKTYVCIKKNHSIIQIVQSV